MWATAWTAVMKVGAALAAVAEDFVVFHVGEGVLDAGAHPWMSGVVLLTWQQGPSGVFAVWDDEPGVDVRAVGRHGHAPADEGWAGTLSGLRVRGVARVAAGLLR